MNYLLKYRRWFFTLLGILPLVLSLWGNTAAMAATARSDISIRLVANRSRVRPGQTITYTAYMTNHGPDAAIAVDTAFVLPPQLSFISETCDLGISPDSPNCEYSSLAAGQTVVSTLVATPTPGMHFHGTLVRVRANVLLEIDCSFDPNCTFDPNRHNNTASVVTRLSGR